MFKTPDKGIFDCESNSVKDCVKNGCEWLKNNVCTFIESLEYKELVAEALIADGVFEDTEEGYDKAAEMAGCSEEAYSKLDEQLANQVNEDIMGGVGVATETMDEIYKVGERCFIKENGKWMEVDREDGAIIKTLESAEIPWIESKLNKFKEREKKNQDAV